MSTRIFVDTNVVIDFLGERQPFYTPIARILTIAEKEKLTVVVSSLTFATTHYVLSKFETAQIAKEKLRKFKILCEVSSIDDQIIEKGLNSKFKDFEDALQYFSATNSNCELIITRNGKDFKHSHLPVMTPCEFLKTLVID